MSDKIDISQHTNAICQQLSLEPSLVRKMTLTPGTATIEAYKTNENGAKYVVDDEVQVETLEFKTRT